MWFLGAFECKIEPYITYLWIGKGDEEEMLKIQLSRDQQVAAQWQSKKKKSFHPLSSHTCVAEYGMCPAASFFDLSQYLLLYILPSFP